MRYSALAVAILIVTLAACKAEPPAAATNGTAATTTATDTAQADARFADISKRWLDGWLQLNPVGATQIGDHRFDNEVDDLSAVGRQKYVEFSKKMLAELDAIDATTLGR
ncbi:MAG: DUF885 domain-containing protein, partial [Pseudomonadota bacterium]|nr:DUF885 domain-containing protein [Pseudomonadota bacterium]